VILANLSCLVLSLEVETQIRRSHLGGSEIGAKRVIGATQRSEKTLKIVIMHSRSWALRGRGNDYGL